MKLSIHRAATALALLLAVPAGATARVRNRTGVELWITPIGSPDARVRVPDGGYADLEPAPDGDPAAAGPGGIEGSPDAAPVKGARFLVMAVNPLYGGRIDCALVLPGPGPDGGLAPCPVDAHPANLGPAPDETGPDSHPIQVWDFHGRAVATVGPAAPSAPDGMAGWRPGSLSPSFGGGAGGWRTPPPRPALSPFQASPADGDRPPSGKAGPRPATPRRVKKMDPEDTSWSRSTPGRTRSRTPVKRQRADAVDRAESPSPAKRPRTPRTPPANLTPPPTRPRARSAATPTAPPMLAAPPASAATVAMAPRPVATRVGSARNLFGAGRNPPGPMLAGSAAQPGQAAPAPGLEVPFQGFQGPTHSQGQTFLSRPPSPQAPALAPVEPSSPIPDALPFGPQSLAPATGAEADDGSAEDFLPLLGVALWPEIPGAGEEEGD